MPSINADPVNPNINLEKTPFYIQKNAENWKLPADKQKNDFTGIGRRAMISSFGAGGSNVNLVLEEFQNRDQEISKQDNKKSPQLIILSAKEREPLIKYIQKMVDYLI